MEVGGEAVHVLVIGQQCMCLGVEEVDVPDAQQSQQNRSVLVQRSSTKVFILQQRKNNELSFFVGFSTPHGLV